MKPKNMTSLQLTESIGRSSLRRGFILITLALACFALSPKARAVCEEGCDTNANTFLGDGALANTTTGAENTATGAGALGLNTAGSGNTASGSGALHNNTTGSDNTAIGFATLSQNTTANSNTATGSSALGSNTTGYRNTADWRCCAFIEHNRSWQHGDWLPSTLSQHRVEQRRVRLQCGL